MAGAKKIRVMFYVLCAALPVQPCAGTVVPQPYINGHITAAVQTSGDYEGLYKFQLDIQWYADQDLGHVDLLLPADLDTDELIFGFDEPAGYSTGQNYPGPYTVNWAGQFDLQDPSTDLAGKLIKFEPIKIDGEPGKAGSGQFWFYSDAPAEHINSATIVTAKSGPDTIPGQLVPEPAPLLLLGLGGFFARFVKRKPDLDD